MNGAQKAGDSSNSVFVSAVVATAASVAICSYVAYSDYVERREIQEIVARREKQRLKATRSSNTLLDDLTPPASNRMSA